MPGSFDAIIVGAGQAGPPLAARLGEAGMTVALIERHLLGGTCVNTGCTPTKTLVASARTAFVARRAADFGVTIDGDVRVDLAAVQARQREVSTSSRKGLEDWVASMERCTLFRGHARFVGPHEIEVGDELLRSDLIFLNVGGRVVVPDLPGIDDVAFLTNSSILELQDLPRHLVVVGGGYIGLEFAQMFRRFGSAVTVVERGPRLLGHEDPDIREAIQGILEQEGIAVRLGAECIHFEARGVDIAVGVSCEDGPPEVVGSHVLLAMGRRPNTDDLGLDVAGVAVDERGVIEVDDSLQTNVPGIYALGDMQAAVGAYKPTTTSRSWFAANLLDGACAALRR